MGALIHILLNLKFFSVLSILTVLEIRIHILSYVFYTSVYMNMEYFLIMLLIKDSISCFILFSIFQKSVNCECVTLFLYPLFRSDCLCIWHMDHTLRKKTLSLLCIYWKVSNTNHAGKNVYFCCEPQWYLAVR